PSAPMQRPSGPIQRPASPPQRPTASEPPTRAPRTGGRHALPESDGMHRPDPSPQADRVRRARRHRTDED
ncbi:hypothetical protein DVB88_07300, partial [Tsukamurella pulmonis]